MGKMRLNMPKRKIWQALHRELTLDRDTTMIISACLAVMIVIADILLFLVWKQLIIKPPIFLTWCMVIANMWLVGVSFYNFYDTWKEMRGFRFNSKTTTGKVIRVQSSCWDDIGIVYYPIIEYKAGKHKHILKHNLYSSNANRYKLENTYRLVYWLERPEQAAFYPYLAWKKSIKFFVLGLAGSIAIGSVVGLLYLLIFTEQNL